MHVTASLPRADTVYHGFERCATDGVGIDSCSRSAIALIFSSCHLDHSPHRCSPTISALASSRRRISAAAQPDRSVKRHTVTPEEQPTWSVINPYGHLMTKAEWCTNRAFIVKAKVEHGYSPESFADKDTSHAEVLALMRDGPQLFWDWGRDRIIREHAEWVVLTCCPKFGGLARTPRARQCHCCFHDCH
jgi:hypothetical protein